MSEIRWILRWTARIAGAAVVATFLMLLGSELVGPPHSRPPTHLNEWTAIALASLAALGLLIAYRNELAGSVLSLFALAAFAALIQLPDQRVLLAFAVPGVLYLMDAMLSREASRR